MVARLKTIKASIRMRSGLRLSEVVLAAVDSADALRDAALNYAASPANDTGAALEKAARLYAHWKDVIHHLQKEELRT